MRVPSRLVVRSAQRGHVLTSVLGFSVALVLLFTLVANILPQVEGEAPVEKEVDLGALTMDGFVSMGEELFKGKGTCTLCHNNLGRAPDILVLNMADIASERLADERYQGSASDVEGYLRESMVDPSGYVVATFGKKGSNDTESPMPTVDKAPLSLSDIEMDAIIAFMQAKDGNEVTVALPTEAPAVAESGPATGGAAAPAATGEEAIGKYGCSACHVINGSGGDLGPSLAAIGGRQDGATLQQSIVDPNAVIAEGYAQGLMPADFGEKMTVSELMMIVELLQKQ